MDHQSPVTENTPKKRSFSIRQTLVGIVLSAFIFSLGVGIGSGRIMVGPDSVFRKPVQNNKGNLPEDLDYSSVEQVYDALKREYDGELEGEKLLDGLKQGLAKATGDNYTEYLNAKEAEEFNNDLNGTFSGIGAELGKEEANIVIVAPIEGYPAEKAGLKPQDIIAEIDGETAYDLSVSEAVKKIRGPEGTKVKLKVVRNKTQPLDFEITRQKISIPSVKSEILEGNIGYLKISRFSEDTSSLAQEAATKFKAANVRGVILDMRSNPGGLLDSAVDLSSLWLPTGKTVLEEKRDGKVIRTFTSKGTATLVGVPTVVLINEGSASASEITAGALKDNNVATLMGMKSFGKGSVQQLEQLQSGGVLKVTIARWFTPSGKNIDKEGISPDTEIKISDDDLKNARDPQKQAAIDFLKK